MDSQLPSGTVTFLFTDIEGSTPLWEQMPDDMRAAVAQHNTILREAIESNNGQVFQIIGDAFAAAFPLADQGLCAAVKAQQALAAAQWGPTGAIRVRMGLHTGPAEPSIESEIPYKVSHTLNRTSRVMSAGHGGQILLSQEAADLARRGLPDGVMLQDMGEHSLKGMRIAEHLYQALVPGLAVDFPPIKSLSTVPNNLPVQRTSFIGRARELVQVKKSLTETQLLTLLGPGGTGKTRLMLEAAEDIVADFPNGVWLVELATLTNPNQIPERVAAALNVQEMPGRQMIDTLTEYLRRKEILLLLDNVEHLVAECAEFSEHLLANCPLLKILVTGREALFISGETTIQIPSLSLPKNGKDIDTISKSEGVQLFLERARGVRSDFELTSQNAAAVVEVVQRLDGIPLALELAAARLRMLTVEQIDERLDDRFRLLTGGSRTALPRQQTLQALIDWSWNLLEEKEQVLLRRLAVFSGGWNLESAQFVAGFDPLDEFDVFEGLEQLINKSLVAALVPSGGEARYNLLESIRQYAQVKLFDAGEGTTLRDRHVDFFVAFSLEAEKHLSRSTMLPWVDRIILELDNIRSALGWAQKGHPELALRICATLLYEWAQWIHPSESLAWLEASLEATRGAFNQVDSPVRSEDFIRALHAMGFAQALLGNVKGSLETVEEVIRLAQKTGDLRLYARGIAQKFSGMVQHWIEVPNDLLEVVEETLLLCQEKGFESELNRLHIVMGDFLIRQGKIEAAKSHYQELEVFIKKYQNPRWLAAIHWIKGQIALVENDLAATQGYLEQAAAAFAAINDQRIALICKSQLSHLLRRSGKIEEAVPYYQETLLKWQEQGNPIAVAHQLECFAYIGIAEGQFEYAAQLLGIAKATRTEMDAISSDPQEVTELEQAMTQLTQEMGGSELESVMAEGAARSLDQAVQLALSTTTT